MSDSPFINFYTSDFLAGTGGMTASTRGVYITLLCLMYEQEAPLAQSWDTLARRCGCTLPAFKAAILALEDDGKIDRCEAGLWSKTCDKHIALRRERRSSARSAAKRRWQKGEQKQGKGDAAAMRTQCYPKPEPDIGDTNVSLVGDKRADDILTALEAYNEAASKSGWPRVQVLTKARRAALKSRLAECGGIDGWQAALDRARNSGHCCGQNDRGWTASFDFLTRQSSFAKLMEGNYDDRPIGGNGSGGATGEGRAGPGRGGTSMAAIAARRRLEDEN